ncbi:UvrD-helicase domain-containing protein, partial [Bacteroidota bacterium]
MILTKENIDSVNIDNLINDKIQLGSLEELLILVPTNRKLRHLKKDIISMIPGKTAAGINIETIGTIATKLLETSRTFIQLSEAAATVLIKQSTSLVDFNYFSSYKGEIPYGTLDRIKNVISEYKKHGITSSVLKKEAEKLERNEKLKALDIANIYEFYIEKCRKLNALEIGDIYRDLVGT